MPRYERAQQALEAGEDGPVDGTELQDMADERAEVGADEL